MTTVEADMDDFEVQAFLQSSNINQDDILKLL